jgi:phosphomevalonate kinase
LLKEMGKICGCEIEPDVQTELLDKMLLFAGVICCGVPGGTD